MFLGQYSHKISKTNNLTLPARFREELNDTVIISSGFDECLFLFSDNTWEEFYYKISNQNIFNSEYRHFVRFFTASSYQAQITKKGNIHIEERLRNYALLDEEITIIGVKDRVEIWNPLRLNKYNDAFEKNDLLLECLYHDDAAKFNQLIHESGYTSPLYTSFLKQNGHDGTKNNNPQKQLFLCHSSADNALAIKLSSDLLKYGIKVWIDKWEMKPGDSLFDKIQDGIDKSAKFAILLSPESVSSKWCKKELAQAMSNEINETMTIIPILCETCEIPGFLREKIYVDIRQNNYKTAIREILKVYADI